MGVMELIFKIFAFLLTYLFPLTEFAMVVLPIAVLFCRFFESILILKLKYRVFELNKVFEIFVKDGLYVLSFNYRKTSSKTPLSNRSPSPIEARG